MAYYNANKEFISGAFLTNLTNGKFTTPANCRYIYFSYDIASTQFGSIMLNEGTTALSYEPYNRSIIANKNIIYEENNYENYAITETRIGTWIDGKPLYRKVFTGTTSSNGNTEIAVGNIKNIINVSGYIKIDNDYKTNFNTSFGTNGSNDCRIVQHINDFIIQTGSVLNNKEYTLCLEYTKTTD